MFVVGKEHIQELRERLFFEYDINIGTVDVGNGNALVFTFSDREFSSLPVKFKDVNSVAWYNPNNELIRLDGDDCGYRLYLSDNPVCSTLSSKLVYDLICFIQETVPVLVYGSFLNECSVPLDRETRSELHLPLGIRRLHTCKAIFWRMSENNDKFAFVWPTRIKPSKLDYYSKVYASTIINLGGRGFVVDVLTGLQEHPVSIDGNPVTFGQLIDHFQTLGVEPISVFPV